jgi:tRNA(fMet)-specific endonuclease VapC
MICPACGRKAGAAAMYLFDTDTITNVLKKQPSPSLLQRLATIDQSYQYISTITVAEIVYGAFKSGRPRFHLENLERILLPAVNIVSFDSKAAYVCGRLRAELEGRGEPLSLADLEIGAIAIANDLTLITGNTRHFARIPDLVFENWLA